MDRVATEIAQKVGMLFQHDRIDPGTGEEQSESSFRQGHRQQ